MIVKPILIAIIIHVVAWQGKAYEGTPSPEYLDGMTFVGTVESTSDKDAKPIEEEIKGGKGEIHSQWASKLGFDALKWNSIGEISGIGKSATLEIWVKATNADKDSLEMNVVVADGKKFSAKAKLVLANKTTKTFSIDATLKPRWFETDDFKKAAEDLDDIDLAIKKAPAHYLAPNPETEKKLDQHVSFAAKQRTMGESLFWLAEQIKTPIACEVDWAQHPNASIDATDKSVKEVLDNLTRQTQTEYVVRGRAIVITKPERAAKLKLKPAGSIEKP